MIGVGLAEAGFLPDWIIRRGIQSMLRNRLRGLEQPDPEAAQLRLAAFIDELRQSPVALTPELANEQHYEVAPGSSTRSTPPHFRSRPRWPYSPTSRPGFGPARLQGADRGFLPAHWD